MDTKLMNSNSEFNIIKNKGSHLFFRLSQIVLILTGFIFVLIIIIKFFQIKAKIASLQEQNIKIDDMILNIKQDNSNIEKLLGENHEQRQSLKVQIKDLTEKLKGQETISNEILQIEDVSLLKDWIWKKLNGGAPNSEAIQDKIKLRLIYKADPEKGNDSRHDFIQIVGKKSPLIIVVESKNRRFGAFTSLPLNIVNQHDSKSFLFHLNQKKKYDLLKTSTYSREEALFFGEDFILNDGFFTNKGVSNFPSKNVVDYPNIIQNEFTDGFINFTVLRVEVYQITNLADQ